jgi:hypothetical protein
MMVKESPDADDPRARCELTRRRSSWRDPSPST